MFICEEGYLKWSFKHLKSISHDRYTVEGTATAVDLRRRYSLLRLAL